jgi:hypothetical protein
MSRLRSIKSTVHASIFLLAASVAQAATVSGTAQITGGPNALNLQYSDNTSPVVINEVTSIFGPSAGGTVLGVVNVTGADDGTFRLYQYGQGTHANESRFHFSETVTNSAVFDQQFRLNFRVDAGALETSVHEIVPKPGEYLEAGYQMSISFGGTSLFTSGARLRQVGTSDTTTMATLSQSGSSFDGVLEQTQFGAPDTWHYVWNAHAGTLDLGVLAAGASATLEYDAVAFGSGIFCGAGCGHTMASIGDPSHLSSIGGPGTIVASAAAVPEPDMVALMLAGLVLLGFAARREKQRITSSV